MSNIKTNSFLIIVTVVLSSVISRIFPICLCILYISYLTIFANNLEKQQNINNKIINIYENIITKQLRRYFYDKKITGKTSRESKS